MMMCSLFDPAYRAEVLADMVPQIPEHMAEFNQQQQNCSSRLPLNGQIFIGGKTDFYDNQIHRNTVSLRVFLGALPKTATEVDIIFNLRKYHIKRVDWPNKDSHRPMGYAFVDFADEGNVLDFLGSADCDEKGRYEIKMDFSEPKFVEVKPFFIKDAQYGQDKRPDDVIARQIFVGGLPRDSKAKEIRDALSHFGKITEVSIDLNMSTLYPKGSAIVTFANVKCCRKALLARVHLFKHFYGNRQIEMKPRIPVNMVCPVCCIRVCSDVCIHPDCYQISCNLCWHQNHCDIGVDHESYRSFRGAYYTNRDSSPHSDNSMNSMNSF